MGNALDTRSWVIRLPHLCEQTLREMRSTYPQLMPTRLANTLFFRGPFEVKDEHSAVAPFKPFQLEVELPSNFPEAFPIVRETDGDSPEQFIAMCMSTVLPA